MVIRSDILFDKQLYQHLIVDVGDSNILITGFEIVGGKKDITKEQYKKVIKKYIPTSMYIASKNHPTFPVTPYSEVEKEVHYPPSITREKVRMTPEYVAKNISRGCIQDVSKNFDLYYPITVYWPKKHKPSETFMEQVLIEIKKINKSSKHKVAIYNGALRSYNDNNFMMTFKPSPLVKDQARKKINRFVKQNWEKYYYSPEKKGFLKTKKHFEDLVGVVMPKKKSSRSSSSKKKSSSSKKKSSKSSSSKKKSSRS